jgi:hypothetical protein
MMFARAVGDGTTRPGESWEKPCKYGRLFFTQEITEFRARTSSITREGQATTTRYTPTRCTRRRSPGIPESSGTAC